MWFKILSNSNKHFPGNSIPMTSTATGNGFDCAEDTDENSRAKVADRRNDITTLFEGAFNQ